MILRTLKTFFRNLIYIFVPLGCLFLGGMIGAAIMLRGAQIQCAALADDINALLVESKIQVDELIYGIVRAATALSWENPIRAISQMLSPAWLSECISGIANVTAGTMENFAEGVSVATKAALDGFKPYFSVFLVFAAIGMFAGYFVTKFLVKRSTLRYRKFFLWSLLESAVFFLLFIGSLWLISLWKFSFYIALIVLIPLFGFLTMVEAYFSQPKKNVSFKQVVDIRNSYSLALSYLILLVVSGALLQAVYAIGDALITFSLAYPLITIILIVMGISGKLYLEYLEEKLPLNAMKKSLKATTEALKQEAPQETDGAPQEEQAAAVPQEPENK